MPNWLVSRVFDNTNPQSIASMLRVRRIQPLIRLLEEIHAAHGHVRLLDIGGTVDYWKIVPRRTLEELGVRITIANPWVSATATSDALFNLVEADGCDLSRYGDREFHVAHSNSVLEHVGGRERMKMFASDVRRVAQRHFVQTPNFWFPVEPHAMLPFIHWLPYRLRIALVQKFALGHWPRQPGREEAQILLSENDLLNKRDFTRLFPESEIRVERFLGLPKSLLAIG